MAALTTRESEIHYRRMPIEAGSPEQFGYERIRFRPEVEVDVDRFYEVLLEKHATVVGPGHWFEQSRRHFRLGYG